MKSLIAINSHQIRLYTCSNSFAPFRRPMTSTRKQSVLSPYHPQRDDCSGSVGVNYDNRTRELATEWKKFARLTHASHTTFVARESQSVNYIWTVWGHFFLLVSSRMDRKRYLKWETKGQSVGLFSPSQGVSNNLGGYYMTRTTFSFFHTFCASSNMIRNFACTDRWTDRQTIMTST